jgi:hypothetical protein
MTFVQAVKNDDCNGTLNELLSLLDEGIDDLENGRIEPLEQAWVDIDSI